MTAGPGAPHPLVPATADRWRELTAVLASAFADDPVFGWLLPREATRRRALERFFALETRRIVLRHERSFAMADGTELLAAALVLPPGRWRTPLRVQGIFGPRYVQIFGRRLPHALGVLTDMERRHPRDPHVYLPYIGVVAAAQSQGLGTALLRLILERCDHERLPAYLEASNPRCARLYARLGFETVETIRPLGAPPIELMSRPPASVGVPTDGTRIGGTSR
jgi:GNAT superfamily N-acetyltransferase